MWQTNFSNLKMFSSGPHMLIDSDSMAIQTCTAWIIEGIKMVRGKLFEFCRITSIKGIQRLLRTKSTFMRFIWTISVIGFLFMALFQATLLTVEYFQYNTFTSAGEVVMDYFDQSKGTIGTPDITLCNVNPFASNRKLSNLATMEEYFNLSFKATICDDNSTEEERVALKEIRNDLMSTSGYFNYIGRHNCKRLGHARESFFAHCVLDNEVVGKFKHVPCLPTAQIIEVQTTMLFNCYTIRLPRNQFPDKMFAGFLVVLHLDDYRTVHDEQSMFTQHAEPGQMAGVWSFAHQRNTPLYTYQNRILLQPGHFHEIPVKMEQRTYLPPPHGYCQDIDEQDYYYVKCFADWIQTHIYNECGCLEPLNYTSQWDPVDINGPLCLSLSLGKDDLITNWKCMSSEKMKRMNECSAGCPFPCKEMRYNFKVRRTILSITSLSFENLKMWTLTSLRRRYKMPWSPKSPATQLSVQQFVQA